MTESAKSRERSRRSPGRPKPEEATRIDEQLLELALREFLQHGYGGASLTRMVRKGGISKTTLYSRFDSKQALFQAIIQQQIERLSPERLLQLDGRKLGLAEGLKSYADNVLRFSLEGDFLGVNRLMYSESHRFPELGRVVAERSHRGIQRIADFIRDCAENDGVACRDPRGVAEIFILMLRGWFFDIMLSGREVSARERRRWVELAVHTLVSSREDW
jgi:AcrR family transcriptional regulator